MLLLFGVDGERLVVVASAGGAQDDPQWCKNLRVDPEVRVERAGHAMQRYTASEEHGEERERLFAIMTAFYPRYPKYQRNAGRLIPVVVLTPVEGKGAPLSRCATVPRGAGSTRGFGGGRCGVGRSGVWRGLVELRQPM